MIPSGENGVLYQGGKRLPKRLPRIEDVSCPKIGQRYSVPVVQVRDNYPKTWGYVFRPGALIPILGPAHEDAEHINFPDEHWHIDWRFVDKRFWNRALDRVGGLYMGREAWRALGLPINTANAVGEEHRRAYSMKREMPTHDARRTPWLPALEKAYQGTSLKDCRLCPHRGLPLKGIPSVNGMIHCPGHGLRWDDKTGALVPH